MGRSARLDAILRALPLPIYVWQWKDGHPVFVDYNDAASKASQAGIKQWLGSTDEALFPDEPKIPGLFAACFRERRPMNSRFPYRYRASNLTALIDVTCVFVPPDTLLACVSDVTERQAAETALRESEERQRHIIAALHEGLIIVDGEGRITSCNPACLRILEIDEAGLLGKKLEELPWVLLFDNGIPMCAHERPAFRLLRHGLATIGALVGLQRDTGTRRWISLNVTPLSRSASSLPEGAVLTFTDVTEQKVAEDALRKSNELYASVVAALDEGVMVFDRNAIVQSCNERAARILGVFPESMVGRRGLDPVWKLVHPDGSPMPREEAPLAVTLRTRQASEDVVCGTHRPDGSRLWVRSRAVPLFEEGTGELAAIVCSLSDVTELKEAEESLRALSTRLLRLRDEERRRIARELHDQTAQGLAALSMNLEVISRSAINLPEAASRALVECRQLAAASGREVRTLSYLLHPPLLEEAGLESALRWFCDGVAARSGMEVAVEISGDSDRVSSALEVGAFRIVQEALTNVYRHSGSPSAIVRLRQGSGQLRVEVEDRGRGMAPDVYKALTRGATLGVGFASMRERVRELGGRLDLRSGPQGTLLQASLPIPEVPS